MSIQFEVIDLNCQASNASFFVPRVLLSGKSTTSYATLYGYSEFTNPSTPPKKYRTVTLTGTSQRIAYTVEQTPRQCAGAKYIYSGYDQVNFQGVLVHKYTKNFFAQCAKEFWPHEVLQLLPGSIYTSPPNFVGFCWTDWSNSCDVCDPTESNWPFLGDKAVHTPNVIAVDLNGFMHSPSDPVITQTSWSINSTFHGITTIGIDTIYTGVLFGTDADNYTVTVGSTSYTGRAVVTNPPTLEFPVVALRGNDNVFRLGNYINFTDTNNYSAVLSDEYTDADAAAHATIVTGTGKTAQNMPRTTGFTSVTTSVVYTLDFVNLISGETYTATVDLWDQSEDEFGGVNIHTLKTYTFTATGATHSILDTIPTPDPFHTITVNKPTVAFAT